MAESSGAAASARDSAQVRDFRNDVLDLFPFTSPARTWLSTTIDFQVADLTSFRGGGYWYPDRATVFLFTAQYEAAIHELAHAWWHYRRPGREDAFIETVQTLAAETEVVFRRMATLARGYISGIVEQHWPGLLVDRNDWEMYAGLASGMIADIRLLPPYIRTYYADLFDLLPPEAASPASGAPHQ